MLGILRNHRHGEPELFCDGELLGEPQPSLNPNVPGHYSLNLDQGQIQLGGYLLGALDFPNGHNLKVGVAPSWDHHPTPENLRELPGAGLVGQGEELVGPGGLQELKTNALGVVKVGLVGPEDARQEKGLLQVAIGESFLQNDEGAHAEIIKG